MIFKRYYCEKWKDLVANWEKIFVGSADEDLEQRGLSYDVGIYKETPLWKMAAPTNRPFHSQVFTQEK